MRRPIANPILDVYGEFPPDVVINPYAFAPAASFSPLDISGCVLWLKADGDVYNTGTTQATDGQTVSGWVNAAASGTATPQGTAPTFETNEVNGKPVLRLAATKSLEINVSITGTTLTAFMAMKIDQSGYYARALSLGTDNSLDYDSAASAIPFVLEGSSADLGGYRNNSMLSKATSAAGAFGVFSSKYDGTNHTFYANGSAKTAQASSGTFNISRCAVGANLSNSEEMQGDVAEVLIYDTALSTADREAVENYLGDKYGITITH